MENGKEQILKKDFERTFAFTCEMRREWSL